MIKKLLSVVLFTTSVGVAGTFAQSNCTPDISCVPADSTFGICPDSAQGLPTANAGQAYNVTMSIKIPGTTTAQGQTVTLSHLALTDVLVDIDTTSNENYVSITTIGLDYLGSGANTPSGASGINGYTMTKYCYWSAPSNACVVVSGTPTMSGTFPVKIKSQGRAIVPIVGGLWSPAPDNTDYKLVVTGTAGVELLNMNKFEVAQNAPNPFSEKTVINYSSPSVSDVDFKVYNLVGAVVYSETVKADKGSNSITLKANAFAPGVYMYALKNGNQTITKRMVVTQ